MTARTFLLLAFALGLLACGRETEPDDGFGQGGITSGDAGASGAGGQGGAGRDAQQPAAGTGGSEGGRDGGTAGTGGIAGSGGANAGTGGSPADGGAGTDSGTDAGPCPQGCSDPNPHCDEATNTCVQCLESDHCSSSQVCSDDHRCVECNTDDDCDDLHSARCDPTAHACVGCTNDDQCTRFADTPVCDEERGTCVACTRDTEAERCGTKACQTSTGTCTETDRGSLIQCDACQADSECGPNRKCVEHVYGSQSVGHFCFFDKAAYGGCAYDSDVLRPYSQEVTTTSIDGVQGTYCLPVATCQALADATNYMHMGPKTCSTNGDCGVPALDDGFCPTAGPAAGRCTYTCADADDCPTSGFTQCSNATGSPFCQP